MEEFTPVICLAGLQAHRYHLCPLVYVFVLFGSFLTICAILGGRILLRHRSVRKFVRSIRQRINSAEERGAVILEETKVAKPRKSPRTSAVELQQVRSLLRQGEKAVAQGKFEDGERIYIQALTINPNAHDIRAELGKLYLSTERDNKAEAMYRELLRSLDDVSFHSNLGLAYYRQGKFEEACLAYAQALQREPKNPDRSAALGRACIAARRFDEAIIHLEKAVERLPRDTALLQLLADCYFQIGNTDQTQVTLRKINKIEPYNEAVKEKLAALAAN